MHAVSIIGHLSVVRFCEIVEAQQSSTVVFGRVARGVRSCGSTLLDRSTHAYVCKAWCDRSQHVEVSIRLGAAEVESEQVNYGEGVGDVQSSHLRRWFCLCRCSQFGLSSARFSGGPFRVPFVSVWLTAQVRTRNPHRFTPASLYAHVSDLRGGARCTV